MVDRSIGRAEIESWTIEPNSPDPVLETYFRRQLEQLYADPSQAFKANNRTKFKPHDGTFVEKVHGEAEGEYDFRLFTRPSDGASNVPQRIALRSPSPARGEPGFATGGRPDEYYFAGHTDGELAKQYARAAVSSQNIIEGLRIRWKGMELPWRVTVIGTTKPGNVADVEHPSQAQTNRRKRSGKKRRLAIRKRFEARATKEIAARQTQVEKEAAEREKRTRKNREKKVKKKQKDKLKKVNDVEEPA